MNFIWFVLAGLAFYFLYWYLLSLIIFLPQMPLMSLIVYLSEKTERLWAKILWIPAVLLGFLFGTLLPCSIYGAGLGLIALKFAENATLPLIYFFLGGFGAFMISAPGGETSFVGMLLSLGSFILVVTTAEFALISAMTIGNLFSLVMWAAVLLVVVGIFSLVISFIRRKIHRGAEE